jgi:hypothetical protein
MSTEKTSEHQFQTCAIAGKQGAVKNVVERLYL